jgi:hypothetical protein
MDWWLCSRKGVPKMHQKAFDSIIILIPWSLWCHCNDRVFTRRSLLSVALVNEIWAAGE